MTLTRPLPGYLLPLFIAAVMLSPPLAIAQNMASKSPAELVEVLTTDSPKADKALACKFLAIRGSKDAVPALAPLLTDEELHSWARIALEAIPGAEADDALREAAGTLQGRLLIGAINSIGVRSDAAAIPVLTKHLKNDTPDIAAAAAVALGKIGNVQAATVLRKALSEDRPVALRSAIAQGCILAAENLWKNGDAAAAVEIYDVVRKTDVPFPRIIEATRGAILARGEPGLPLLIEQLRSPHKGLLQVGLSTAREFPGSEIDKALAAELATQSPERAAVIITAMADRKGTVQLDAILKAAQEGPLPVRLAATEAIGQVGNATCVPALLEVAVDGNADLTQAAKAALAELSDETVDKEILTRLSSAKGKIYLLLIQLVGSRQIEATEALTTALESTDSAVRTAALTSLGATIPQKNLSVLIRQVVAPKRAEDAAAAQLALKTAAVRMPDREDCATQIAAAMDRAPAATKGTLLEILAAVGGTKALATMETAAKGNDAFLQDVSTRLLGEWSTIDAAPVLLNLAKNAPGEKYQVRAMRGYIRIARQFVMPEAERLVMCQKVIDTAQQTTEKKLVLEILKRYPSLETLKMAINLNRRPELKDDAMQAALFVAQKLGGQSDEVKAQLAKVDLPVVKLEIVKGEYGARAAVKDVTKVLQARAGDLQLIALPADTYNEAFAGDPAPNTVKQLKIQYRINGRSGEATFAENALIVLPLPK